MNEISLAMLLNEKFFDYYSENDEEENNSWQMNEEFFDYYKSMYGGFYIYKNPTIDEIKSFLRGGSRGFIAPTGDLYMEGYEKSMGSYQTHTTIFQSLAHKGIVTPEYANNWFTRHSAESIVQEGIAVQRVDKTNKIALSESLSNFNDEKILSARRLFNKCKRQGNAYWEFIPIKIFYLEP